MADKDTTSKNDLRHPVGLGGVSLGVRQYLSRPVSPDENIEFSTVLRFLLLHLPLMLIFRAVPLIATAHSLLVFLLGLLYLLRDRHPARVASVIAYAAGAEILWRGTGAVLVWEYGKYVTIILCALMILKFHLFGKAMILPTLFVLLLIPGIFIAPGLDRQAISFQLAGPIAMGVASIAFGRIEFKRVDIQRIFLGLIATVISMGFLIFVILLTQEVSFYSFGENEAITGGIGANQVASALSLGAMAAFFYVFLAWKDRRLRSLMIWISLALLGLSVLTFTRAGLWNMVGAIAVGALFLFGNRRWILNTLGISMVVGLFVYFIAFPFLNDLTGGALALRFRDFDSTGRDVLVRIDYETFQKNMAWGVGVGESPKYHIPAFGYPKPTHTEYSRLLAEHGLFGVVAILVLALIVALRASSRRPALSKGISMGFTTWALLYMIHSATRMVAPAFAFGFAAASVILEEETKP